MTLKVPVSRASSRVDNTAGFEHLIHRLVGSDPALRAIESGQADAIMDPATGKVFGAGEL